MFRGGIALLVCFLAASLHPVAAAPVGHAHELPTPVCRLAAIPHWGRDFTIYGWHFTPVSTVSIEYAVDLGKHHVVSAATDAAGSFKAVIPTHPPHTGTYRYVVTDARCTRKDFAIDHRPGTVPDVATVPYPTSLVATFGSNRFPSGANTATAKLTFTGEVFAHLDVSVTGSDVRAYVLRIYTGRCYRVGAWYLRTDFDGNSFDDTGQNLPVVRTNEPLTMAVDVGTALGLQAVLTRGGTIAFMLAGAGAGPANNHSALRTCVRLQSAS